MPVQSCHVSVAKFFPDAACDHNSCTSCKCARALAATSVPVGVRVKISTTYSYRQSSGKPEVAE